MEILSTLQREKLIQSGQRIGIAVSGGSDSMALFHFLCREQKALGIDIVCINVEHGLRGKASIGDSRFVEAYCKSAGVPFVGKKIDVKAIKERQKISLEQAARDARYAVFYELIRAHAVDRIAVAHNAEDNVESVLMHLFRGSGLRGVSGMEYRTDSGIIRPLLDTRKVQILQYLEENDVPYVTDETNADTSLRRNYVRLKILPSIESVYPGAAGNILRFAEHAKNDCAYLDQVAEKYVSNVQKTRRVEIDCKAFCHSAIGAHAVMIAAKKLGQYEGIESAHIKAIAKLSRSKNSKRIDIKNGIFAIRENDRVTLMKEAMEEREKLPFQTGSYDMGAYAFTVTDGGQADAWENFRTKKQDDTLYLSMEQLSGAEMRFMRQGDVFTAYGGMRKKLSKFMSDRKIPAGLRGEIPVIARGNEILAVIGLEISDAAKVSAGDRICRIDYRRR